ncbi:MULTISPECIES: hypothetical protein [unclassified Streptomyces]|nr:MULTISPECIES: hypothetical protein [unclassified Streptomyces]
MGSGLPVVGVSVLVYATVGAAVLIKAGVAGARRLWLVRGRGRRHA